jgi:hypothetical protein
MHRYGILNSRKRVVVALVHNLVFLGVATLQVWRPPAQSSVLAGVYGIVAAVLAVFTARSRAFRERLYFACCMSSAALGLLWQLMGDRAVHPLVYLRVILLGSAALIGFSLLRVARRSTA